MASNLLRQICVWGLLIAFTICCTLWSSGVSADRIVLKDGTVETSEKIWESEQFIHFILNGTRDVEIRYSKEIVERIERSQSMVKTVPIIPSPSDMPDNTSTGAAKRSAPTPVPAPREPEPPVQSDPPVKSSPPVRPEPAANPQPVSEIHQQLVQQNKGLNFYDPRRPMRYWAMRNSKHKLLDPALTVIASQYGRSANWVEAHMGHENDLGVIHGNLGRQFQKEMQAEQASLPSETGAGDESAPRETSDPVTPPKAASEPAEVGGSVSAYRETRIDAASEKEAVDSPGHTAEAAGDDVSAASDGAGIRFYDPRRGEKYWSGRMTRHQTLQEALDALARQYGVSPSWIETHMGDTNDLSVIHRNIRKNLKKK